MKIRNLWGEIADVERCVCSCSECERVVTHATRRSECERAVTRIISLDYFNSYQIICLDYFFFVSLQRENS